MLSAPQLRILEDNPVVIYLNPDLFNISMNDTVLNIMPVLSVSDALKLYPNPVQAGQSFMVEMPAGVQDASVMIYNLNGQLVQQQAFGNDRIAVVATRDFAAGVYTIRITSKDNNWVSELSSSKNVAIPQ